MSDSERAQRGNEMRMKIFGVAPEASENFKDIMDVTVEHLFGDIWTRDGLALRDRSLITVATLIALNREAQLRVHLRGALNVGVGREEIKEMIIAQTPLKRLAAPEDIAGPVLFLASDWSRFMTGQTLYVDGGLVMG